MVVSDLGEISNRLRLSGFEPFAFFRVVQDAYMVTKFGESDVTTTAKRLFSSAHFPNRLICNLSLP